MFVHHQVQTILYDNDNGDTQAVYTASRPPRRSPHCIVQFLYSVSTPNGIRHLLSIFLDLGLVIPLVHDRVFDYEDKSLSSENGRLDSKAGIVGSNSGSVGSNVERPYSMGLETMFRECMGKSAFGFS
jgi:hypothetical protein